MLCLGARNLIGFAQVPMSRLADIIRRQQSQILQRWMDQQQEFIGSRIDAISVSRRAEHSKLLLNSIANSLESGNATNIRGNDWQETLGVLETVTAERASAAYTAAETATYIFSLKQPLFFALQEALASDPAELAQTIWTFSTLLDGLGLYTIEIYQKTREEIIRRQQVEMLELSTPVVALFEGLIALPLIGTLDSARTQIVMENLLNSIVQSGARIAILDITGVPTVDTQVAQHLLKTVSAARLMGAECIISGVRPQIAQTIVHLGVELNNVTTKATMADALRVGLQRLGYTVLRPSKKD